MRQPVSVLFVCMGNICRPPTAEGVAIEDAGGGLLAALKAK